MKSMEPLLAVLHTYCSRDFLLSCVRAGWKQTVQALIERFQDLTDPIQAPPGDIEEGRAGADGKALRDGARSGSEPGAAGALPPAPDAARDRSTRALVLQQASQRITQNTMGLQKLRAHFQKVPAPLPVSGLLSEPAYMPRSRRTSSLRQG